MAFIFKLFLALIGFAVSSLLAASALHWLELAAFASILRATALLSWLSAYVVIGAQSIYLVLSAAGRQLGRYFSADARAQRELLFKQNRHVQIEHLHHIQRQHLHDVYERQRLQLLDADNKKQRLQLKKLDTHSTHD